MIIPINLINRNLLHKESDEARRQLAKNEDQGDGKIPFICFPTENVLNAFLCFQSSNETKGLCFTFARN